MIATPAGGLLAHRLSEHRWFEKGESDLIVNGGLVGALYGVAIPYLADIEDSRDWTQAKIYVASAMAGVPAGVWATTRLIRGRPIDQGRAHSSLPGGRRRRLLRKRHPQPGGRGGPPSPRTRGHARLARRAPVSPTGGRVRRNTRSSGRD